MDLWQIAPLLGLKGDIRYNYTYQRRQLILAVVQISLPSAGILLVRPVQADLAVPLLSCTMDTSGGYLGTTVFRSIQPGQQVYVNMYAGFNRCALVAPVPTNKDLYRNISATLVNNYSWTIPGYKTQLYKTIKQDIQKQCTPFYNPNSCPPDLYSGDYLVGDKNGGNLFVGRTCVALNGSCFSSLQLDGVNNKLAQLYHQKQEVSLNRYQKKTIDGDFKLQAVNIQQGLGKQTDSNAQLFQDKGQSDADIQRKQYSVPVFRRAQFSGLLYEGQVKTINIPISDQDIYTIKSTVPTIASETTTYTGEHEYKAQKLSSVKTPYIVEPRYIPVNDQDLDIVQDTELIDQPTGVDAPLLQQLFLQNQKYTEQKQECMFQDGFFVFPDSNLRQYADWQDGLPQTDQYLAQPKYYTRTDGTLNKQITFYNNTSFIEQAKDGSIFIKDGWGSQIRLTRGNIIISSALDTFIRPGRDLIQLIPRLKQTTTNGPAVLASKQSIKIAAQTDVKIASAISGGIGSTVLENRTGDINSPSSGVVIRSNADMTITASKDLYIGLNDKSKQNAGQNITKGTGTFILDVGDNFAINAKNSIKLTAGQVQIYGYSGDTGAGITINSSQIAASAMNINMQGFIQVGTHSNGTSIQYNSDDSFTIRSGSSAFFIEGPIQATNVAVRDLLLCMNNIIGQQFATKASTQQDNIPTLLASSRAQIQKVYGDMVKLDMQAVTDITVTGQVPCYKDSFICDRQLKFNDSATLGFGQYSMPGMCWQQQAYNPKKITVFQPVTAKQTGSNQQSKTYPGVTMWQSATISIVKDNKLDEDKLTAYKTNVSKTIEE